MLKNSWLQMISMLQGMQEDDSLQRGSITIIAKKVQCGMQHSIPTMGMGSMHMCHRHNYLTRTQFPGGNSGRLPIYPTEFV